MCVRKQEIAVLGLLSDHAADMVICSSEGCDESSGVDSLVVEIPGVQCAGSPHKCIEVPLAGDMIFVSPSVSANIKIAARFCFHTGNLISCNKQTQVFIMI